MRAQATRIVLGSPSYFRWLFEQSDEGTPRVPPESRRQSYIFGYFLDATRK